MDFDFAAYHKPLSESESALKLGQLHCTILAADNCYVKMTEVEDTKRNGEEFSFSPIELTPFGEEVAGNLIKWWVRKKISLLGQMSKKVEEIRPYLDNLKHSSLTLSQTLNVTSYEDLIISLRDFAENHHEDINALFDFVMWLSKIDEISPCVLFTHPPWSMSQRSDRYFKVEHCDGPHVLKSMEVVFGLSSRGFPTLAKVKSEMDMKWAESIDPEYETGPSPVTYNAALPQSSREILDDFALYFQKIRDSVDLLQSELLSFSKEEILRNEGFLRLFISKALPRHIVECELWDFKATIPAWHNTQKEELKSDFACNVASFANSKGGLILVGIDDQRIVVGVDNVETRIQQSRSILESFLVNTPNIEIFSIPLENSNKENVNCIAIKIPQTKDVVEAKVTSGGISYKYPIRMDDGIRWSNHQEIANAKKDLTENNFTFSKEIFDFVYFTES